MDKNYKTKYKVKRTDGADMGECLVLEYADIQAYNTLQNYAKYQEELGNTDFAKGIKARLDTHFPTPKKIDIGKQCYFRDITSDEWVGPARLISVNSAGSPYISSNGDTWEYACKLDNLDTQKLDTRAVWESIYNNGIPKSWDDLNEDEMLLLMSLYMSGIEDSTLSANEVRRAITNVQKHG